MPGSPASLPPLEKRAVRFMRARRRVRWLLLGAAVAMLALLVGGMALTGGATDHDRYHQRRFEVVEVVEADRLRLVAGGKELVVRLIGVDANGSAEARRAAAEFCGGEVMLYLETVPTRNHPGELMAYVYSGDGRQVNALLVESGLVFADRRWDYSFLRTFLQAEEQARSRKRGIWPGMTQEQMPEWRQRWLAELERDPWKRREWRRADEP